MNPAIFDRPSGIGALLGPGDIATPTAGYSLRNLSISYFGQPVVRVRRESDDVEQDFTASQITDGTLGSFCTGTNGFVHTWYDQFGSNDAVQVTDAEQPKIWDSVTGLVTENGKPALDFDGVDDYLVTTSAYPTGTSASHFYVASSTGTNQRILDTRGTGAAGAVQGWHNKYSNTSDVSVVCDGLGGQISTQNIFRSGRNLVSVLMSLTSVSEYTNSVLAGSVTGAIGSFDSGNSLYIGANTNGANTQIFDGTTQEIVLYNSDQSANRTAIEDNINNYYDIY